MNTLMTVVVALMISATAYAGDGFDKLYSKYSGNNDITSINLTKSLIKMASKFLDEDDEDAKVLLQSIESVKLLVSEKGNHGQLATDAKSMIKSGNYEDLIKVNDGEDHVRIMVKESGDLVKEIVIFADSGNDFALINILGSIDPEQIGKVLSTLDIKVDGLEGINVK